MRFTRFFLLGSTLLLFGSLNAQVTVNSTNSVAWYVQNVLLGANVTVSNITFNGTAANANVAQVSVGEFTNPLNQVGLVNGMIMATGSAMLATQTNTQNGATLGSVGSQPAGNDPQLASIVTGTQYDKCIVEFDFVPTGDSIKFRYVFASEEYPQYVCSGFNDAFGFFVTGPNPSGGNYTNYNVARVPSSLNPLAFTNTPVAINTINSGVAGGSGTASTCAAIDPNWQSYNVYFVNNPTGGPYEYNGRTIALPATLPVICGETYHIKLAIADLGDASLDSGVFLEAGSFASNGIGAINAIVPSDVFICDTSAALTLNFSAGANPPPYSFWDFGDGIGTSTDADPSYTYADTGYYQVMYVAIDSSGACGVSDTAYFNINLIYPEQFSATFDIPVIDPCDNIDSLLVEFAFTGTGADSLIWNMGNGTIFYDVDSVAYTYLAEGVYEVSLIAIDTRCNHVDTLTATVNYVLSYTAAQATVPDDIFLCATPLNVDFIASNPLPPHSYWDFDDGTNSTLPAVTHTYAQPGSYNVMYVAIDSSTCNIADSVYFNVTLELAETFSASIDFTPPPPCGSDSMLVQLYFTGTGADSLVWDMGNGDVFVTDSMEYYYTVPGTYNIVLTAYDLRCNNVGTIANEVFFAGNVISEVQVPNIFTPNGDGINDRFGDLDVDGTEEYHLVIYNRWGRKVFETETATVAWDGKVNDGADAESGVYFFEIRYRDLCKQESIVKSGFVTLVR